jgi:two-component system response regulator DesR
MTRILVVEDQALVRGAICSLLSLEDSIEIVGEASDGQQGLAMAHELKPDIVLTDIEMPNTSGIELAAALQTEVPDIQVMIMTTFSKSGYIKRAINAGVKAFILKEAPTDYLVNAINKVIAGEKVIEPELAMMALEDDDPLTDKERQALRLAGEGLKTAEIAARLYLSEGTIRNYLSEAISKLHATNRIDASRIAKQKGWL